MNRAELSELYIAWLKGKSLRAIAANTTYGHSTIHAYFKKEFGTKACNRDAQSLVRSLIEDYPDQPDILEWGLKAATGGLVETQQHRSNHSMNMLSQYQTLDDDELLDTIAFTHDAEEETLDFLRLPLYKMILRVIAQQLNVVINFINNEQTGCSSPTQAAQGV